jgi:Domain of unknown function (DUF1905)
MAAQRASDTGPELARFLNEELGESVAIPTSWQTSGTVWIWRGSGNGPPPKAAWYFLNLTGEVAAAIRSASAGRTGGFGSVRVDATIGGTSWQTSLFSDRANGAYMLPLKAAVRRAEALEEGVEAVVRIAIVRA